MAGSDSVWCRKLLDMNQAEFARFLGVSVRTVQNWDYRKSMPPLVTDLVQRYYYMALNYVDTLEHLDKTPQSRSAVENEERRKKKVQRIAKK